MAVPVIVSNTAVFDAAVRLNPTYTFPTVQSGDLMLLVFGTNSVIASMSVACPAGAFTQRSTVGGSNLFDAWVKLCDGSESGTTITATGGGSRAYQANLIVVRGSTTIIGNILANQNNSGSSVGPATPAVTTLTNDCRVVTCVRTVSLNADPITVPSSWALLDDGENPAAVGSSGGHMTSASKAQLVAGSTGSATWTFTATSGSRLLTISFPDGSVNTPPIANAGAIQYAAPGAVVTLIGSGFDSDGTIASYQWTVIGTYATDITLSSPTTQNSTFTAPNKPGTVYSFGLVVTDNNGVQSPQSLTSVIIDDKTTSISAKAGGIFVSKPLKVRKAGSWSTVVS